MFKLIFFYVLRIANGIMVFRAGTAIGIWRYGPDWHEKMRIGLVKDTKLNYLRYMISHFTVSGYISNFATLLNWREMEPLAIVR